MSEILRVEEVTKTFDRFVAVQGVSLSVEEGTIAAVIGPNGAGKTTLFNLITGILHPNRGRILFQGEEITYLPPHVICQRGIGRTFQIANVFPRLSVFTNVQVAVLAHQRRSLHFTHPAERLAIREAEVALAAVGLLEKAGQVAGTLSHGDQRLLEIAIALGTEPRLLLLDEPTAGMSPEETVATMKLIRRLAQERGLTILFCEHDMEVVFATAYTIMVMHHGRILAQGPPEVVRAHPEVQQAYLGASDA
ncbi:MAG: ABC transporter ATP-binding protein [Armatimonadota bacterium]|nr:ABC transporter ATP-binding protein [Armatimonadota bacterium]